MGKSSSNDELTIRNQFDRICKLALKGEAADYYRHIAYRQKHEVLFSESDCIASASNVSFTSMSYPSTRKHLFSTVYLSTPKMLSSSFCESSENSTSCFFPGFCWRAEWF